MKHPDITITGTTNDWAVQVHSARGNEFVAKWFAETLAQGDRDLGPSDLIAIVTMATGDGLIVKNRLEE